MQLNFSISSEASTDITFPPNLGKCSFSLSMHSDRTSAKNHDRQSANQTAPIGRWSLRRTFVAGISNNLVCMWFLLQTTVPLEDSNTRSITQIRVSQDKRRTTQYSIFEGIPHLMTLLSFPTAAGSSSCN